MSARWSVLLGVVGALSASGAAVVPDTYGRMSTNPVGEVAARKGDPPRYRYIFSSDSAPTAVASHGWNLLDVSSQSAADQLPGRTRGMMYMGDYDNSTCDWEVSDIELTAKVAAMAGDPKVAGYYFSDEPDPHACPTAPGQHRARSQLIHGLDPGKMTLMTMDSNSGHASLDQIPLWGRPTTWVWIPIPATTVRRVSTPGSTRSSRRRIGPGSPIGAWCRRSRTRRGAGPRRARRGTCSANGPTPASQGTWCSPGPGQGRACPTGPVC